MVFAHMMKSAGTYLALQSSTPYPDSGTPTTLTFSDSVGGGSELLGSRSEDQLFAPGHYTLDDLEKWGIASPEHSLYSSGGLTYTPTIKLVGQGRLRGSSPRLVQDDDHWWCDEVPDNDWEGWLKNVTTYRGFPTDHAGKITSAPNDGTSVLFPMRNVQKLEQCLRECNALGDWMRWFKLSSTSCDLGCKAEWSCVPKAWDNKPWSGKATPALCARPTHEKDALEKLEVVPIIVRTNLSMSDTSP